MEAQEIQKELDRIATEASGNVEKMRSEVNALKAANQELVQKNEGLAAQFHEFEQNAATRMVPGGVFGTRTKSIADQIHEADSVKSFVERDTRSASIPLEGLMKNVVSQGAGQSGDSEYDTHPQRDPRLANDPRRRLTLLDALPSLPMTSGSFEYVQLDGYTNAAAEQQTEGTNKAQAAMPTTTKSVKAATIAHFLPVSEQVLQDNASLAQQVSSLLQYGVLAKAESLIVGGTGDIDGLESEGTAFNANTGTPLADAVGEAEAQLDIDGWQASHVILHPNDWHSIRSERTSQDEYVASGWNMPAAPNVWGLQVVATPSVTEGSPIVLDASQVAILDRMAAIVELFRQDATNVQQNLVTMRAEARMGLAVFAANAVRIVNIP